jgi:hypothetical protein
MSTQQEFVDAGYNHWVAEALEGQELDVQQVLTEMSEDEIMGAVFDYHGMIHMAPTIRDAVDNIRNVEAL